MGTVHIVTISKLPEFTPEGEVVPGQCEPYTGGWKLKLVEGELGAGAGNGRREELLSGTYYEVRRVQRRCLGKTPDEIRKIAADALEAMKSASGPPLPGETDESTQILGIDDVRRAMMQMELSAGVGGGAPQAEWVVFSIHNGVSVASVRPGDRAVDPDEFGRVMEAAFGSAEAGLVVDLGHENLEAQGLVRALRDLGERARAEGRFFGLASASDELEKAVAEAGLGDALQLYADIESAVSQAERQRSRTSEDP